jgi:hypothetical protein
VNRKGWWLRGQALLKEKVAIIHKAGCPAMPIVLKIKTDTCYLMGGRIETDVCYSIGQRIEIDTRYPVGSGVKERS